MSNNLIKLQTMVPVVENTQGGRIKGWIFIIEGALDALKKEIGNDQ